MVIADEHDFGVVGAGVVEEPGEFAGADHRGFVHHHNRPSRQPGEQGRSSALRANRD